MKLVMTLLARDEADVIASQIAFHLDAGVDFVVATDHRSADGTTEILEGFAREGHLHLIREDAESVRQGEWVTRMARIAAAEHGADWVLNADADEFWWPRGGSLKEALRPIQSGISTVGALVRVFAPRPDDDRPFWERPTVGSLQPHRSTTLSRRTGRCGTSSTADTLTSTSHRASTRCGGCPATRSPTSTRSRCCISVPLEGAGGGEAPGMPRGIAPGATSVATSFEPGRR